VRVHSLTLSYTLGSMKCDSEASLLTCTFVNPCFGCEPKARVVTPLLQLYLFSPLHLNPLKPLQLCWLLLESMNVTSSKEIERSWREFLFRAYVNNKARELLQDTSFINWHMGEKLGMNSCQVEDEICVLGPMCIF